MTQECATASQPNSCWSISIARQVFAVAGFVFFMASSGAAGLGEIRVRSALGERFDATVSVAAAEGENLSDECFKIVIPHDEGDMRVLRHARIAFRKNERGGEVHVTGSEVEQEPLLKVALSLRCPEENIRGITREYSVLLDLRESRIAAPPEPKLAVVPSEKAPTPRVATTVVPEKNRNSVRASAPQTAQLPQKSARADKPAKQPKVNQSARPLSQTPGKEPGEFRLQLSSAQLDMGRVDLNLSEEEKLKLRERLLLIESDDQTAQLLQLKDRINRLEKQLAAMQSLQASTAIAVPAPKLRIASQMAAVKEEGWSGWWWGGLALLLLGLLGLFVWRQRASHKLEQDLYLFDTQINTPDTLIQPVYSEPEHEEKQKPLVPVRSADEWGSENVDVVSPNTVAEEAQLLLDHGLVRQAIDLLLHEVEVRPTAVALWMKLFDAYRMVEDKKGFQTQALAFQQCFASEALWHQVQAIGRELDPLNSLYIVAEAQSLDELAIPHNPEPSGNDDFDILDMMQRHVPAEKEKTTDQQHVADVPLEFHLPEISPASAQGEWPNAPFMQEGEHLFGFDAPTLELPVTESPDLAPPLLQEEFVSTDPVLQTISRMYFDGQQDEACQQLEELLYKGSFDQRMTAARWLDRLLPVKDK